MGKKELQFSTEKIRISWPKYYFRSHMRVNRNGAGTVLPAKSDSYVMFC